MMKNGIFILTNASHSQIEWIRTARGMHDTYLFKSTRLNDIEMYHSLYYAKLRCISK